ncbi:hypothetical protein BBJ28_00007066 [Nothophytophthora sp. Chile5]|nr:hypothetical protein BBJ28_00007066 [Nothophytophthora sp. Chile5]
MTPGLLLWLAVWLFSLVFPVLEASVLLTTPENEATLTQAAVLYQAAQQAGLDGDVARSQQLFQESIAVYPELASAYNNLAMLVFEHQQDREQAEQLLARGLQAAEALDDLENVAAIRNNLGFLTRARGQRSVGFCLEALAHFDAALQAAPEFVDALYNKASVLHVLRHDVEAESVYHQVLTLDPDHQDTHLDLGRIYFDRGELKRAIQHQEHVIAKAKTTADWLYGMHNKGIFLKEFNFLEMALAVYNEMLSVAPDEVGVLVDAMTAKRPLCHWEGMETLEDHVLSTTQRELAVRKDGVSLLPYDSTLIKVSDAFRKRLAIASAKVYDQHNTLELLPSLWLENEPSWSRLTTPKRLKVGYLSFDFRDHPMGHLTLGLIEQHTALASSNVETFCFSYGPNRAASEPWRRQFEEKCDVFRDLYALSDLEAAQIIGRDSVDVLVDLMAHTKGARLGIQALRPSRIAVNYLGFPGTTGSSFTDFVLVDRRVLPPEVAASSMTEQVVYLPHSYQVNRYDAAIEACGLEFECQRANRSLHGLPQDALVFCNFNTINKMEHESFSVWMNILKQVPGSVLWLLAPSGYDANRVMESLREQAKAHGVLASRLIFAPRADKHEHLARVTLADLFLDSFIYNAHSTAADALWAHVPIVTFWGDTFPSRVAASLIQNAMPFPELVPHSVKDYERLAVYLATTPKILRRIRHELAVHTLTSPLFDTQGTTASVEVAYEAMHDVTNRLHPFTTKNVGQKPRFQLLIQPARSAQAFRDVVAKKARLDAELRHGIALQEAQEFINAHHVYTRVLRANPSHADAIQLLGTLYVQTGELDRAVTQLTKAVEANPHVSFYHANLGVAYLALDEQQQAEHEFQRALDLNASNLIAVAKLTEIYAAQSAFDKIINVYKTFGEATYFQVDSSRSNFQVQVSQKQQESAYLAYAYAFVQTGRIRETVELLDEALERHPTFFRLGYNLAALLNTHGEYDHGDKRQLATALAESRYVFQTQGRQFQKIPRPSHKVVLAIYCNEYGQSWWGQWGPSSVEESGLGGSEEAVVFLSRELQKLGYWVEVYGNPPPQDISTIDQADEDAVRWYPHYAYDVEDTGVDMFVAWRYHISLALGKAARKAFLWMHDVPQQDTKQSPELVNNVDAIFCGSEFHASKFPDNLRSKIVVATNALDPTFFVNGPNHANRFVYGSAPNRGLHQLLKVWPLIREHVPNAELSVFYGFMPAFQDWGRANMANFTVWEAEVLHLLTETPGVRYVGLVDHARLAKEYSYAGFYLYPTTFSETSCISLMKAMANGAIPVTSRLPNSALSETCGDFDLGPRPLREQTIGKNAPQTNKRSRTLVSLVLTH